MLQSWMQFSKIRKQANPYAFYILCCMRNNLRCLRFNGVKYLEPTLSQVSSDHFVKQVKSFENVLVDCNDLCWQSIRELNPRSCEVLVPIITKLFQTRMSDWQNYFPITFGFTVARWHLLLTTLYSICFLWPISFSFRPTPLSARGNNYDQWWNCRTFLDALYHGFKIRAKIKYYYW